MAAPVSNAAALAGQRFYKLSACAYQSRLGSQGQNTAADADTLSLDFDSSGNASSTSFEPTYSAAQVNVLLAGAMSVNGMRWSAYRLLIDGMPKNVIIDRGDYDSASNTGGALRLWLQE